MSDFIEMLSKLADSSKNILNTELPTIDYPSIAYNIPSTTVEIDEENTFAYQMQKQTDQILAKSNEQIEQLKSNYQKLEDLYKIKEQEVLEARKEAKKAKKYNVVMLIIAIVSMLVAIAAWLLPNILGGAS